MILAIGSVSRVPDLPGLAEAHPWTNVQGTSTRELPRSLAILGAGPTGVELAQVYARYDVPVTLVHPRDRVHDKEHPRSTELLGSVARARRRHAPAGCAGHARARRRGQPMARMSSSSTTGEPVEGHEILLAIGRDLPLDGLGLETIGVTPEDGTAAARRSAADRGERVRRRRRRRARAAHPPRPLHRRGGGANRARRRGVSARSSTPSRARPTPTRRRPRSASCSIRRRSAGSTPPSTPSTSAPRPRATPTESDGHCTIVVDRAERVLVGAFLAGPAVSEIDPRMRPRHPGPHPAGNPGRHDPRLPDGGPRPRHRLHRRGPRPGKVSALYPAIEPYDHGHARRR